MGILPIKNILRRGGQSGLTVFITAVAIFTFVVIFGVFSTFQQGMALSAARLGADFIVLPGKGSQSGYHTLFTGEPQNVYMNKQVMQEIGGMEGVAQMTPQFFTQTMDESCCSSGEELRLVGYDRETDFILAP